MRRGRAAGDKVHIIDLAEACQYLRIPCIPEVRASHCSFQPDTCRPAPVGARVTRHPANVQPRKRYCRDTLRQGRVRAMLKDPDGSPVKEGVTTRACACLPLCRAVLACAAHAHLPVAAWRTTTWRNGLRRSSTHCPSPRCLHCLAGRALFALLAQTIPTLPNREERVKAIEQRKMEMSVHAGVTSGAAVSAQKAAAASVPGGAASSPKKGAARVSSSSKKKGKKKKGRK